MDRQSPLASIMLAGLLGAALNDSNKPKASNKAAVATLRAAAKRYSAPLAFKIGDLVTPRADSSYTDKGDPSIVIDVQHDAGPIFVGTPSSNDFGCRYDLRVLRIDGSKVVPFWVESTSFEHYDEAKHGACHEPETVPSREAEAATA